MSEAVARRRCNTASKLVQSNHVRITQQEIGFVWYLRVFYGRLSSRAPMASVLFKSRKCPILEMGLFGKLPFASPRLGTTHSAPSTIFWGGPRADPLGRPPPKCSILGMGLFGKIALPASKTLRMERK